MSVTISGSDNLVLQVVSASTTTNASTTSTSFVTTGLTASITPKFSTSKILVVVTYTGYDNTTYQQSYHTIYKGSTNLGQASYGMFSWYGNVNNPWMFQVAMNYLDSPATTSSITYAAYMRSGAGQSIQAMPNNSQGTITLMEIAG